MSTKVTELKNKKVLIIDDEDILRDVLSDVMGMIDLDSLTADGGRKGVEIYKKHQNDIDLVLLDLLMPDESGIETYQRLSVINPDVNVIFMSGVDDQKSLQNFSNNKECVFIKKPFSMDEITQKVKHCLRAHRFKKASNLN